MSIRLEPLAPVVGVEVLGLDLRADQPANVRDEILDAFWQHHLVLVRGPELDLDDQIRFACWFGEIIPPESAYQEERYQAVESYMSNVRGAVPTSSDYTLHRDYVHLPSPCASMCLHGQEVTTTGGETIWADAEAALERLAPTTRGRIAELRSLQIAPATRSDPTFDPD